MKGTLNLGKVAGIKIEVHWTFMLLLVWVVFSELQRGGTLITSLFSVSLLLILFVCVVLHELGHALVAKRFNTKTQKITLLPIGGMATMDSIPEKPGQEMLVALAGPAVNLAIALVLYLLVPVQAYLAMEPAQILETLNTLSPQTFLFYLFVANVMLVVFNLVPAFPMDGGRVLRSLLALWMDRVQATRIAAGLGEFMAVIFFFLGVLFNPFLILIALFIFISAYGENQMVAQASLLEGHTVKEAMLTNLTKLHPENSMREVVDAVMAGSETDFIVIDRDKIVGVLYNKQIIAHARESEKLVEEVMQRSYKTVETGTEIKKVLALMGSEKRNFFPVVLDQQLVGAIDMNNISEYMLLKATKK
tara:strand:+ start:16 stop:1101 length:1086 start_codon:yes stop_codon:yes gene_type:complete